VRRKKSGTARRNELAYTQIEQDDAVSHGPMILEFLLCRVLIDVGALARALALNAHGAFRIAGRAWFVWVVCWMAMAFFSKSTKRRESPAQRLEHMIPAVLGFVLIFREGFGGDFLSRRIIPETSTLPLLCVAFTILGLLFSVWARFALGSNWSGTVTIKTGHQLIRRGPYRFIRHPIYTGMLAALLATAIAQGLVSGLVGFALILLALYRKARREEKFLAQEFGEGFTEHREHTGMFLPRFS
jgi:protein-S-isoprenylcysteine O-methyltransferase Ste14